MNENKSEKAKMLSGELYNSSDKELSAERTKCKILCRQYNVIELDYEARHRLLSQILGKLGANCVIEPNFYCDYGYNISVGDNFYVNHNSVFLDCAPINIGDNVMIGPNCGLYTAAHPLDAAQRLSGQENARPINIGNNVWLGGNVCVLGGVTIGNNCVIGAGSVVTKDIPADSLAFGNPAVKIRRL